MRFQDLAGQRFGKLVVLNRAPNRGRRTIWNCQCDCGKRAQVGAEKMKAGTVSCGCYITEVIRRHGHTYSENKKPSRTYKAWVNMRSRVDGVTDYYVRHYTSRGIAVCAQWHNFDAFLVDMGECPPGLSLDRKDNDGNYEPGNCRWATRKQQAANTRRTLLVVVDGETMCLAYACERIGVKYNTAHARIRNQGMTPQEALGRPVGFSARVQI